MIQVVGGMYKNTPHPPGDKWLVKKLYEESGEWEQFEANWRPFWACHLPARRRGLYHPSFLELLKIQDQYPNEADFKKKRKQCNDEFFWASVEFKRRKSRAGLIAVVEWVKHRNKVAQTIEFEKPKHNVSQREEYLDGFIQADKLSFTQKQKYFGKFRPAGLQDLG